MDEVKHTPGPWQWWSPPTYDGYEGPMDALTGPNGSPVMNCGDCTHYYPTEGTPPNEADARLIAASPDLLAVAALAHEMATAVLGEISSDNTGFLDPLVRGALRLLAENLFHKASAAIANATGN